MNQNQSLTPKIGLCHPSQPTLDAYQLRSKLNALSALRMQSAQQFIVQQSAYSQSCPSTPIKNTTAPTPYCPQPTQQQQQCHPAAAQFPFTSFPNLPSMPNIQSTTTPMINIATNSVPIPSLVSNGSITPTNLPHPSVFNAFLSADKMKAQQQQASNAQSVQQQTQNILNLNNLNTLNLLQSLQGGNSLPLFNPPSGSCTPSGLTLSPSCFGSIPNLSVSASPQSFQSAANSECGSEDEDVPPFIGGVGCGSQMQSDSANGIDPDSPPFHMFKRRVSDIDECTEKNAYQVPPSFTPCQPSPSFQAAAPQQLQQQQQQQHQTPPAVSRREEKIYHEEVRKCQLLRVLYPPRARLNVYIKQELTEDLKDKILEKFNLAKNLYYYLDISTAFQINDKQMHIFNVDGEEVVLANYDLHRKCDGEAIYAVIKKNAGHVQGGDKWLWELIEFLSADEISQIYGIRTYSLPKSSRSAVQLQRQLNLSQDILDELQNDSQIVHNVDLGSIQKIKRKPSKYCQVTLRMTKNWLRERAEESWDDFPAIPIIVNDNKGDKQRGFYPEGRHWVEWIKLVCIQKKDEECDELSKSYIGISCRFDEPNHQKRGRWRVTSICLDKGDILNKHRLCGSAQIEGFQQIFTKFNSIFSDIDLRDGLKL